MLVDISLPRFAILGSEFRKRNNTLIPKKGSYNSFIPKKVFFTNTLTRHRSTLS